MSEVVKSRPRFGVMRLIDATGYRLPLAGFVSILHRVSGIVMFLLLPFILFLLDKSLTSELSFAELQGLASGVFVKLVILALSWAFLHHFCAGVRHLFMDFHYGLDKHTARQSAVTVLALSLTLTALVALKLFGVF
ncbi:MULTISPECIES: succinate dehydrogenase, cytochrome b556 subunit [unclassified Undibacterium]|uniref:succinate dehydrogenase, cytochrome b556 subunit n=1 Tax=unclassified Undibacterium TaxID=2630295 RepID=UPI002AC9516E|nr:MULTISPECIES: succinate dehydrogenase, cytochrome b556 subunit [unclassified Undibacterium]MEB0140312.1 succinate dehydrogenase, cytochrome b556 subunit [Undibacterium sp. CCC2.1]MEB0173565.1 succinate dehydrogenase, cytochrome b556 subunit [Undibacterium sp. CCC1.1]MEB0177220.1 succinate dehydrogenase, cytochrome b556 subunit [Undibacterium sp. CCC3.4]MEB0216485.1 succinate dehydrogenase, cytochrome b556 subunit [Undibacterium sp. 5I2]WPX43255.1 succinate dehydrogenase, cytochrome b556 sub